MPDFEISGEQYGMPDEMTQGNDTVSRIFTALCAMRGKYIYDRELGSVIRPTTNYTENDKNFIESAARMALKRIPAAEVTGIRLQNGKVYIAVSVGDLQTEIEIGDDNNGIQL